MLRRNFLLSSAAGVAATFLRSVALAGPIEELPPLTALVETILPPPAPALPPATDIAARIDAIFHLNESAAFRGSLAAFSSVGTFSMRSETLFAAERSQVPDADVEQQLARDALAFHSGRTRLLGDFSSLSSDERRLYLELWAQSAFNVRRRFYQSMRFVTFAAFYSLPPAWKAIGYAGPFDEKART